HDSALPPDVVQRLHDQEDEDQQHLEADDPPVVVPDPCVRHRERDVDHAFPPAIVTIEPWSACRDRRTWESAEFVGSQTTLSVIVVITTGSRIEPASVLTANSSPSATPSRRAVVSEIRATGVRAVAVRCG